MDKSRFTTWNPKTPDIPGQIDIFGTTIVPPDIANDVCSKPLNAPIRGPLPLAKEIHLVIPGEEYSCHKLAWWVDSDGRVVSSDNRHPYTGRAS